MMVNLDFACSCSLLGLWNKKNISTRIRNLWIQIERDMLTKLLFFEQVTQSLEHP